MSCVRRSQRLPQVDAGEGVHIPKWRPCWYVSVYGGSLLAVALAAGLALLAGLLVLLLAALALGATAATGTTGLGTATGQGYSCIGHVST